MREPRKCPVCNSHLIKKEILSESCAGGLRTRPSGAETWEIYQCPGCKEVYFEEDLRNLKKVEKSK